MARRYSAGIFLLALLAYVPIGAAHGHFLHHGGKPPGATSSCVATATEQYSADPADSVGRVYPFSGAYNGANTATITISGTTTGTCLAGSVQVSVVEDGSHSTVAAGPVSATLGSGTFTASLTVPAARVWYVGKIVDSFTTAFQARRWGVGVLVLTIGQSNMVLESGETGAKPSGDGLSASFYTPENVQTNNTWGRVAGNGFIQVANNLGPASGYVVGFVQYAQTSTSIASWVTQTGVGAGSCGGTFDGSSWTALTSGTGGVTNGTSGPNIGADFNAVLFSLGESDASGGTSEADYQTGLGRVVCQLYNLTGRSSSTLPFIIDILGSTTNYQSATDATWEAIRQGQITATTPGLVLGVDQYPNQQGNGVACSGGADQSPHWIGGTGGCFNYYESIGYFQAEAILGIFGVSGYDGLGRGPAIASATKTDTTHVTLNLTQQANATKLCAQGDTLPCTSATGSGLTVFPFKVCVNGTGPASICTGGTVETVTATAFTQPDKIVLTVSPAYTPASDTVTFQYVYGFNGNVTGDIFAFDNFNPWSNPAMPGRALQPTVGTITAVP